jgi:hypothetical protein
VTAAESRSAAAGAGAAGPDDGPWPDPPRRRATAARTVASLARVEAGLLTRSVLVLAGLVAAGAMVYHFVLASARPTWWAATWQIGYGQQILALAVLVAGQLAAGRAGRDGLSELYRSFPATPRTRALAQLLGLAGALPASLVLIGGAAIGLELSGVLGRPGLAALAAGVLLVIAGGAIGIAVGTRFAHPLAGVLAAVALLVPFSQSNRFTDPFIWLFPWVAPDQLGWLPGPLAGYPPAAAHAVMLAAVAGLAGLVALALATGRRRLRLGLAAAAAAAVAVAGVAGAVQLRPIPAAGLTRLAAEVADPASVQRCTTAGPVRYCLYPAFRAELPALQASVRGVLAGLPQRPGRRLTIRQTAQVDFTDPVLTHGHPAPVRARWVREAARAPGSASSSTAIYLIAGTWPAAGAGAARFSLALAAAEWAVGLPPTAGAVYGDGRAQCVPLDQAREAIAIWLAIRATDASASELQPAGPSRPSAVFVGGTPVAIWNYPGEGASYLTSLGPQPTQAGYLLAEAMSQLPARRVSRVLDGAWSTWLNDHTSQARLAAALGIPLPHVPAFPAAAGPPPDGGPAPSSPVCGP